MVFIDSILMYSGLVIVALTIILVPVLFFIFYKKVGFNEALVIARKEKTRDKESGAIKIINSKIITGGGIFIMPWEVYNKIDIGLIAFSLPQKEDILTLDKQIISVQAVAQLHIGEDHNYIRTAISKFGTANLSKDDTKDDNKFRRTLIDLLLGHIRAIVSEMSLIDVLSSRKKIRELALEVIETDLNKLGIQLLNFQIDEIDSKSSIVTDCRIREQQIAERERIEQVAETDKIRIIKNSETDIEKINKEKEVKLCELKKEEQIKIQQKETNKAIEDEGLSKIEINLLSKVEKEREMEKNKIIKKLEGESELNFQTQISEANMIKALKEAEGIQALAKAYESYSNTALIVKFFDILPEILPKFLGDKGLEGIMSAISQPLGNVNSINIVDIDGAREGNGGIQKLLNATPQALVQLVSTLKAIGFSELIDKLGIQSNLLNNNVNISNEITDQAKTITSHQYEAKNTENNQVSNSESQSLNQTHEDNSDSKDSNEGNVDKIEKT